LAPYNVVNSCDTPAESVTAVLNTLLITMSGASCEPSSIWHALSSSGLYHSTNSGSSWSRTTTLSWFGYALTPSSIGFGKAATGANYPAIYVGGQFSDGTTGLMRSIDGGANWVKINDGNRQWGGIAQVVGDLNTFGTVYLNAGGGMERGIIYGTSAN
jgi:hypothetical protein